MPDNRIDVLKGLAIISVILIHSWDYPFQLHIGVPYHLSQCVPIFIILAAYNGINSYQRNGATTLKSCFGNLPRRLNRLIWPYFVVFLFEIGTILLLSCIWFDKLLARLLGKPESVIENYVGQFFILPNIPIFFLTGSEGPGSYFVPVIVQLVITLPILYLVARKNKIMMITGAFIINMVFELYAFKTGVPNSIYAYIYLRYLFAAALGVGLAMGLGSEKRKFLIIGSLISLIYITAVAYLGFVSPTQPDWKSQNAPAFMWSLMLVMFGARIFSKKSRRALDRIYCRNWQSILSYLFSPNGLFLGVGPPDGLLFGIGSY